MKYHLKVNPLKEQGEAILNINFEGFGFDEASQFFKDILNSSSETIIDCSLDSEDFRMTIKYSCQEEFLKLLEEKLLLIPSMVKGSRSILIEKLGGWFDF